MSSTSSRPEIIGMTRRRSSARISTHAAQSAGSLRSGPTAWNPEGSRGGTGGVSACALSRWGLGFFRQTFEPNRSSSVEQVAGRFPAVYSLPR